MNEYIKKSDVKACLLADLNNCLDKRWPDVAGATTVKRCIEIIEKITVCSMDNDAAPIKHGKWEYVDGDLGYGDFQCSNCNEIECIDDYRENYKYCPNCGAKMDLESGD